ncbi:MAG: ABC transporter permease [Cytophagales bacterium]|nr:ABC transporter permease [Cytophagales bacterium]
MLRNYFLIAFRSLLKNQIFSFINIFGLAVGITAFLFITQYVRYEHSYEDFHTNSDQVLRITTEYYNGAEYVTTDCETYAPLGPLLKERMPEVIDFARLYGIDGLTSVKAGELNFLETGMYWADHSVFNVFTYTAVHGDVTKALIAPFEVVLTESMAKKYFGRVEVTGESIEIDKRVYAIKAVIGDVPPNTHLKFSFLLSRLSFATVKPQYNKETWNNNNEYTYVLTVPGTDLTAFNKKLATLSASLKDEIVDERFIAEPIKDIHLYSTKSYEPEPNGSASTVNYIALIGLFIIAIAWINYVNLSTARAVERAREVGIRKVMGSLKTQLIWQFLIESVIINIIAGAMALVFFQLSFPILRELSGQPMQLNLLEDKSFWILFVGLLVTGSLLSGIYPAFVLSSFNPVAVLKGKFRSSSHGQFLRRSLVIFQFSATVVLIISMCTVYLQVNYLRSYNLGMNIDQTVVLTGNQVNVPDSLKRLTSQSLKSELLKNPEIQSVAQAESLPGVDIQELSTTSILRFGETRENGKGYVYYFIAVDDGFVSTLNMTLAAGRNFENDMPNQDQVIVNEEAVKMLGFTNAAEAVGSKITFQTRGGAESSTIIGVLKDFHFRSPKEGHLPMLFYYAQPNDYIALQVSSADMQQTLSSIQTTWNQVYPNTVFNYFFLDEKYDQQYRADTQFGKIMAAFSILIIVIACLGLFGLSSYTIIQRTKEIGIRKVLGASVIGIVKLLSLEFAKTVFVAALIALPVAYFAMEEWLSNYAIRIGSNVWIYIVSVFAIMLLAMITVSFQTIKTAGRNPVNSLKQE